MSSETHPTASELRALLDYDPETGVLVWKARHKDMTVWGRPIPNPTRLGNWNIQNAGLVAGGVGNHGYVAVGVCGRRYLAHRMIWAIYYGQWPDDQVDHINRNRADNRICNLRAVDNLENCHNRKIPKNNVSGVVGVGWHSRDEKWAAFITVAYRQQSLGYFDNISDAISARKLAEQAANFHPNHGRN